MLYVGNLAYDPQIAGNVAGQDAATQGELDAAVAALSVVDATNAAAITAETSRATAAEVTKAQALTPTAVKTSNYTAAAGELVVCDLTNGSFTVTLPPAPADATRVAIKIVLPTMATANALTIACGGSDVINRSGGVTSYTFAPSGTNTPAGMAQSLQYKASGAIWYVVADDLPLSQLDGRYQATIPTGTYAENKSGTPWASTGGFGIVGDAKRLTDGSTTAGQATVSSAQAGFTSADVGKKLTILDAGAALGTPAAPTLSTATTLGILAGSTTYGYRIGAVSAGGGVNLGPEATIAVPAGTSTNTVTVSWTPVAGASWHILYGRSPGGELFLAALHPSTTSFVDRGYYTPFGALPASNTAAAALVGAIQSVAAGVATLDVTASKTVTNQHFNYGTDVTNQLLAAAAVLNFVGAGGGGSTFKVDRGRYLISRPIGIHSNIHMEGSGSSQAGYNALGYTGSVFIASGDFVPDETFGMLRFLDTFPPAGHGGSHGYQHWSRFRRLAVDGMWLPGLRGFYMGTAGEQSGGEELTAFGCIDSGFYTSYDSATHRSERLNAVACGYGFNADLNQGHVTVNGISGDTCMSLVRVGGIPGASGMSNYWADEIKGEAWGPGVKIPGMVAPHDMEPVVLLDDLDNGGVTLHGVAQSDDGLQRVDLVKIQKTDPATNTPRVLALGFDAASSHYTNLLRDSSRGSRTVPNSATARRQLWTYGVKMHLSDFGGALVLAQGSGIQTIQANNSVKTILTPRTDDTTEYRTSGDGLTFPHRFPGSPIQFPSFTLAQLTDASAVSAGAGAVVWCSTLNRLLRSDGVHWLQAGDQRLGFPYNFDPGMPRSSDSQGFAANQARYWTVQEGGAISKVGLEIGVSSGNICVACYRQSGTGRSNQPTGTQLVTTGSIACPGTGYQEVALGATIVLYPGDWIGLAADNSAATFRALPSTGGTTGLGNGRTYAQSSAFPLPSTPSSLAAIYGVNVVLVGVA